MLRSTALLATGAFCTACSGGRGLATVTSDASRVADAPLRDGPRGRGPADAGPGDARRVMNRRDAGGGADGTGAGSRDGGGPKNDAGGTRDARSGSIEGGSSGSDLYDTAVLSDRPVGFWAMNAPSGTEPDLSGFGNVGTYMPAGTTLSQATMPNGDSANHFGGATQYLEVPSASTFSIPKTGVLTLEGWVNLATLQFPHEEGSGYVYWLGKGTTYGTSGNQEWMMRVYSLTNTENPVRPNRFSAYAFNPSGSLGSGAYWQPTTSPAEVAVDEWLYVVGEVDTTMTPSGCPSGSPGTVSIGSTARRGPPRLPPDA
jgi:hypothetical protein